MSAINWDATDEMHKRLEKEHLERIRSDLVDAEFDEIVLYFNEMREKSESAEAAFSTRDGANVHLAMMKMDDGRMSAPDFVAWCKETPARYAAMKSFLTSAFFPTNQFPFPDSITPPQREVNCDFIKEVLRDFLSETSGPVRKPGPQVKNGTRNARILQYFNLMSEVTSLPKGTNFADEGDETIVGALFKIFPLEQSSIRRVIKKQKKKQKQASSVGYK